MTLIQRICNVCVPIGEEAINSSSLDSFRIAVYLDAYAPAYDNAHRFSLYGGLTGELRHDWNQ